MIELFAADTPNGKKITIMLEELNCDYKLSKIDLSKDEQFTADFKKISPFSKIPVIIDHDNKQSLFESGAILIYLGEKFNKFYELKERTVINQWLMAQMGIIGPMIGQHHQFHHYNPGKSEFGEERYFKITKRIYGELDLRLASSKFLAGNNYTIADIATWPWLARHEWHDIGLKNYKNLTRWYTDIASRDAVIKGYDLLKNGAEIPKP
ncbi:glutathione S-transferase family protein [Candidatus Pelagibacter bacterium]|nr:glutathione S-transferase family protein [Candidatus Pelagibacter bacterium]